MRGDFPGKETDDAGLKYEYNTDSRVDRSAQILEHQIPYSPCIEAPEVVCHQRETEAWSVDVLGGPPI